jgi:hypothetical protein
VVDWSDTTHYFSGSVAGGLWESKNEGITWRPINDNQENLNITAITQSPFNKNTFYYCTGEPYPINDLSSNTGGQLGGGVFKSTDGGNTFTVLPSTLNSNFTTTWDIEHALNDSNTLYVATEDKGLFKSTDGGTTFTNVFPSTAGITHIEVFPNGSIMIARRTFGIYKSPNGNAGTFVLLNNGFATGVFGLIDFAVCKNFPNVMFAVVSASGDAALQGTYKTSDGGATWRTMTNATAVGFNYTWFCLTTAICPTDTNKLFIGSVSFGYSANSGQSWSVPGSANSHSDYHALITVPGSSKVLCGNDGGIWRYNWNNLGNFVSLNNSYTVTQYYCGSFFKTGNSAIMGAQDNGSHRVLNANLTYFSLQGADGCFNAINQQDDTKGYISYQNATLSKVTNLKTSANVTPMTFSSGDTKWFINPLEINPADGNQIYVPTKNRIYRSTGGAFTAITIAEPIKQTYALGLSADSIGILYYGGSSMLLGRVDSALTTTAGKEKYLTATKPATLTTDFVGSIKVHPTDKNTIFITLTNYNAQPRVWKVSNTDGTPVWTNISGNLPLSLPCNSFEVDPLHPNTNFFVATDFGLYTTDDGGTTWTKETRVPNVCIYNIKLRPYDRKLFVFTHGRGVWVANVLPYPTIKPTADFTVAPALACEGDPVTFSDNSLNTPTQYSWSFENGIPATAITAVASTTFTGVGTRKVKLVVSNAFGVDSIEKIVNVLSNPKPSVTKTGNQVICTITAASYQWYVNNVPITGNTQSINSSSYVGWFKVKTSNANSCSSMSDSVQVFGVGMNPLSVSGDFSFYPNPAINSITIFSPVNATVHIYETGGKEVLSFKITKGESVEHNTGGLSKGVYLLTYDTGTSTKSYKFIKL